MLRKTLVSALALFAGSFVFAGAAAIQAADTDWPAIEAPHTKAWTRWWWHGNAVTAADLTAQMEKYAAAGIGGLEITPIYGVRGGEAEFIDFLAPAWVDMFVHGLREAERLGMEIDMSTGTGWPFGGQWVEADTACRNLVLHSYDLPVDKPLEEPIRAVQRPMVRAIGRGVPIQDLKESIGENADLQGMALEQVRFEKPLPLLRLTAIGPEGDMWDVTDKVDENGQLAWVAPGQGWTLYAAFLGWHGKMVERAGPGGEGNVIDHFSRKAFDTYVKPFDDAFSGHDIKSFRAFFNDSYEVDDASGNSDATPDFFAEFERRRGYDLGNRLYALLGRGSPEENGRVLCDYRETISDLLLEEFTQPWTAWSHKHDALTRNQAHGSPANILDLYAASDIPETEGTDRIQFISASSAAHVTGKPLTSAEACTWLDEHFLGTLAAAKSWCDRYFLGGVNHICYHGTCYSPDSEPWPGRLFYASLELQPTNSYWPHFHALNEYVARCQSFLQAGKPDNDVLVYYPIHDAWTRGRGPALPHFKGDMGGTAARRTVERLLAAGFGVDMISDRQLADVEVEDGRLTVGGVSYDALILPASRVMPVATARKLVELAKAGGRINADGDLPSSAAGMAGVTEPAAEFAKTAETLNGLVGKGAAGLTPEPFAAGSQLQLVRRRLGDGVVYFIVNTGRERYADFAAFKTKAASAVLFDPLTGDSGVAAIRNAGEGSAVRLQLEPGHSCIVRMFDHAASGANFSYTESVGKPLKLEGNGITWAVTFVSGGATLPDAVEAPAPKSWTEFDGDDVKNFSGIGRYSCKFSVDGSPADAWMLDLGNVYHSAEVRLNGESLGTLFTTPYRLRIPAAKLKPTDNVLEIDVANLMANRIADLDRRGVAWKKFYNVNFPLRRPENRGDGGLFSAAEWTPLPSGLVGPVTLRRVSFQAPQPKDVSQWRFDFTDGTATSDAIRLARGDEYDDQLAYGFEPNREDGRFSFSVKVPEGNYRVTATLGGEGESTTTMHAEVRRLLADRVHLAAGASGAFTATVNVRTPKTAAGNEVRLKPRERAEEWPNWDDKLTLTFTGDRPALTALAIEREDRCPTLFLIGDSTVSDQANPPWNSWGQMLPRFFGPTIAVANHAESGESIRGALGERRFEKLYGVVRSGDWVAIQFGHNDMKETAADKLEIYTKNLEAFVAAIRERGATPILITSMERKIGIDRDTLEGYPDAVRDVAKRLEAPLVDLHAMSKVLYRGLGDDLDAAFQDGTHHKDFGSYELARCVVEGIRKAAPELAVHLRDDAVEFDPAKPEMANNWGIITGAVAP